MTPHSTPLIIPLLAGIYLFTVYLLLTLANRGSRSPGN